MTTSKSSGDSLPKPSAFTSRHLLTTLYAWNRQFQNRGWMSLHHPLLARQAIWARLQPHGAVAIHQRGLHRQGSDRRCPVWAKNIVSIYASVAMLGIEPVRCECATNKWCSDLEYGCYTPLQLAPRRPEHPSKPYITQNVL